MLSKMLGLLLVLAALLPAGPVRAAEAGGNGLAPGTAVVFVAGEFPDTALMMVDPAGGLPMVLADFKDGPDLQPTVGPAGQLAWIRRDGERWELMENGRVVSGGELHLSPAYKPDGTLTASVSGTTDTSLFIFRDGGRSLLIKGDGIAVSPSFSPDGSRLAFVSDAGGQGQIQVATAEGRSIVALAPSPLLQTDPAWSPTGEHIAFVSDETDICLIRPDGTGLKRLTRRQGRNSRPGFSPDGQLIVFASDRDGPRRLFIMNLDGSNPRPLLPDFSRPQSQPVWSKIKPAPVP